MATFAQEARLVRRAELLLENPADLPVREKALSSLTEAELTIEERALCPPLVLVTSSEEVRTRGSGGLAEILSSGLPIKVVVLDGGELLAEGEGAPPVDAASIGLANRNAFVVSTSIAHPDHLFNGVSGALEFAGPALIHLYAPSPARHGFPPRSTLERAGLAVSSRLRPLLCYDPRLEGATGGRLSLEGNPAPEQTWAEDIRGQALTPAQFALGDARFARHFTALAEPANGRGIAEWIALPEAERASETPLVAAEDGRPKAVSGELCLAVAERRRSWLELQKLAGLAGAGPG
jgi:pyruvate-ferredoxin/flavodoxin oxidoreductase